MTNKEKALNAINGRIVSEQKQFSSCEEYMKKDFTQFFIQNNSLYMESLKTGKND